MDYCWSLRASIRGTIFCGAYLLLLAGSLALEGSYISPIPLHPDQRSLFPVLVSFLVFGLLFSVPMVRVGRLVERAQRAVCIVFASYLISFIVSSVSLTFFDIFDRLDGDRFAEAGRLLHLGSGDLNELGFQFAGWLWLPIVFVVFWAQRKKRLSTSCYIAISHCCYLRGLALSFPLQPPGSPWLIVTAGF